ncbi:MAG: glycosyltransferase family 87 protein, partial [Actinomycetes bacterium]
MGWFDLRRVWPVLVAAALTTTVQAFVMASSLSRPAAMFGSALDYRISVWGPLRGLAAGLNPYDPGNVAYHDSISDTAAALHLPAVLVLSAPTAVFELNTGYLIFAVASCLMMWLAAIILFAPQDRRSVWAAIVGGVLLTVSGPGEEVLRLGQLTAFVVLGLALVIRYPRSWVGAVGFALVLICPQFAIVLAIFLVGLRRWTEVWRGSLVAVVVSLPVVVVAMVEAGSPNDFINGVLRNLQLAGGVGNATNRMDLPGRYSQGSVLWSVVAIVVVCGLSWASYSRRITPNPELWLGVVAVGLIAAFSMPYY